MKLKAKKKSVPRDKQKDLVNSSDIFFHGNGDQRAPAKGQSFAGGQ